MRKTDNYMIMTVSIKKKSDRESYLADLQTQHPNQKQ
jgi:hypothetical protein